ncbi:MAG: hypothetical protein IJ630_05845 [Treponema sp.]|nr:hypothetical protein [Treponema sp.]
MKKLILAVTALLLPFAFYSCKSGDDDSSSAVEQENNSGNNGNNSGNEGGNTSSELTADFEDYSNSTYLLKVKNNTAKKLVAFKGTPASDTLIGGIPASATNHGLPKSSTLFSTSQDFILFIVTEDDFTAHKDSLSSLENSPFARLYAYYNTNSVNNIVYEISSVMGGENTILLQNNTSYNVELRRNGIYGETIGYTGARTINTTFKVESGDYYVFPVFRKFDKTLNEIVTVYPKYTSGNGAGNAIVEIFSLSDSNSSIQLDASTWAKNVTFTSGYAYIRINNQSKAGISLYNGGNATPMVTSTGCSIVNSGSSYVFTLPMDLNSSDSSTGQYSYAEYKTYSMLHVGNAMNCAYYITGDSNKTKDFYAGKIYTYTVTGNTIYDLTVTLTATGDISEF